MDNLTRQDISGGVYVLEGQWQQERKKRPDTKKHPEGEKD